MPDAESDDHLEEHDMNWLSLMIAFAGGIALGAFFFGGLWWTVSQVPWTRNPELSLMTSFLIRILILLSVLSFIVIAGWERLAICMVGFLTARTVLVQWALNVHKVDTIHQGMPDEHP